MDLRLEGIIGFPFSQHYELYNGSAMRKLTYVCLCVYVCWSRSPGDPDGGLLHRLSALLL